MIKEYRSVYLEIVKDQFVKFAIKELVGNSISGAKLQMLKILVDWIFDLAVAPVLKWTYKEGLIAIDTYQCEKAIMRYKDATSQVDRIDAFTRVP